MTLCDSHIHVVGDPDLYPQAPDRTYTAAAAPLEDLIRAGATRGVERFVVVQPSFYGTDNTVLLEALQALGGKGRGVAVIDPATSGEGQLNTFAAAGVRGLRINLYSTLSAARGVAADPFTAMAAVAHGLHWHVEMLAPIGRLVAMADRLAHSPAPVVIDHYGVHQGAAPDSAEGAALLALLRHPHVWMKLSAPYRNSADPLATRPDPAWLAAILEACGARCVWGSDWPHTPPHGLQTGHGVPLPYRAIEYGAVLDGFRDSLPAGTRAETILCDNPARLYGFT
jgi:predicted TIM-barrel fold metal-dependent hydrolase